MVKLKYRKYRFVSNWCEHIMLWLEFETIFADIPCEKPTITGLVIY